jgi:N-acetylneuraminic acid mutarotase
MVTRSRIRVLTALTLVWLVASASGECRYDLVGDINGDCRVDWLDIVLVAQNWLVDCSHTPQDPACVPKAQWRMETPMSIERDQFAGGVIDGKIYVFGGNDADGKDLNSIEMFDPQVGTWTRRADNNHNAGYGVEELAGAVVDGKLYVFGGWGRSQWSGLSGTLNFVEEYDPGSNTWRSRAPKPTSVSVAPATVYRGEIYLFGGHYSTKDMDNEIYYRVVEAFKPTDNSWRYVTSIPRNVKMFAAATVGTKAYLIGGYLIDEDRMTGDVMTFDFETGQWTLDACPPMSAGRARAFPYSSAAPVVDGKIFLLGGVEGNRSDGDWASNKVDVYDPVAATWHLRDPLPVSVESHLSVVLDGRIYVMGGKMDTLRACFSGQY